MSAEITEPTESNLGQEEKVSKTDQASSVEATAQSKSHKKAPHGERRSLYNVITSGLQQTERATYLHRLIYVGRHSFRDTGEGSEELDSILQMTVNIVNEGYCSEPLTGCFIYYSKHFIHVVEGAEDSIGHHVIQVSEQIEKNPQQFGAIKIILQIHHIRRRYFAAWFSMYGVPRTLIEKIEGDVDDVVIYQIETFYKKILNIAEYLETRDKDGEKGAASYLNHQTLSLLPETNLLDFLLKIDCLETLNDFLKTYKHFPHLHFYEEWCWPPIMDFVPYNVYIEIPAVPILEIPPYYPLEEIEVKNRVAGYKVEVIPEDKEKKKSLSDRKRSSQKLDRPSEQKLDDKDTDQNAEEKKQSLSGDKGGSQKLGDQETDKKIDIQNEQTPGDENNPDGPQITDEN